MSRDVAMTTPAKILIVDDEPFNVDVLEQALEELGYATVAARNGKEALDQVQRERPDLILLDVMMPLMDGFTVCRTLKGQDDTCLIPIVIMTALDGNDDRITGIEAGADDFLTKPVNHRELKARIQTTLRLKQTVDRKLNELRSVRDHFAKFVPDAVRHLVGANPSAPGLEKRELDVSVLFLDISGYSRLTAELPAETLNMLIERYFSTFLDRIRDADGDINETAGDGFMAVFQHTDLGVHPRQAIDAALALLAATERLNEESGHPLSIHIGVNSGSAWVGSTRFEGLHGSRWTFTASGAVTNLAARLAAAAPASRLLIGPETARRVSHLYCLELLDPQEFKNIGAVSGVHRVERRLGSRASGP